MQQKIENGMLYVRATKEEGSVIRSWRLMKYDKANNYWHGPISITLLEHLKHSGGLIPPAKKMLSDLYGVQNAIDKERMRPDKKVECYVKPPVKADLFTHQKRAYNMALIEFGLIAPEEV